MGLRTFRAMGDAFSPDGTPVNIVLTVNNQQVFSGPVVTKAGPAPEKHTSNPIVLCSFDLDDTIHNTSLPVTLTVNGGTLIIVDFAANKFHPANLADYYDPLLPNTKQNIVIDGSPYVPHYDPGETGTYHLKIEDGSTVSFDWAIPALPAGVPGNP